MDIKPIIGQLTKYGYSATTSMDRFDLKFSKENHPLSGSKIILNKSGESIHYEFIKTNPKIIISGFAESPKQLKDKYFAFVASIKAANKY